MPTSVGRLIQRIRLEAGLDEATFAQRLGWRDGASRIEELEQGMAAPDEALARRIIQQLEPPREFGSELLLRAGVLPRKADVDAAGPEWRCLLDEHPDPAYLVDFGWHLLACNRATEQRYGLRLAVVRAERPHVLQLLFDHAWGVRQRIVNWDEVAWRESVAFFLDQASLGTREVDWYRALLRRGAAWEDFEDHWRRIEGKGRRALLVEQGRAAGPLEVRLHAPDTPAGEARFTIGYTQLASDPRLRVARYLRVQGKADSDRE